MASLSEFGTGTRQSSKRSDAIDYRVIFTVAFVVFLAAQVFESLLAAVLLRRSRSDARRISVVARAREAASRCASYACMG
ncbi:MAG: hypothetical protein KDJ37_00605 [Hyphomicrobiaceae bacterium]|nr:hypothetical protein [Hyphomicrobiaceae bacterium]